jgi:hypothetical protein
MRADGKNEAEIVIELQRRSASSASSGASTRSLSLRPRRPSTSPPRCFREARGGKCNWKSRGLTRAPLTHTQISAGGASRKSAGLQVIVGLFPEGSSEPAWELSPPSAASFQISAATSRPRLWLNVDQATQLGVLGLFTDNQRSASENGRPFYVNDDVTDGFVTLKTRAYCAREGHAFKDHELRLKVRGPP